MVPADSPHPEALGSEVEWKAVSGPEPTGRVPIST